VRTESDLLRIDHMKRLLLAAVAVTLLAGDDPVVPASDVLIEKVTRGDLIRSVDGYGKLVGSGEAVEAVVILDATKAGEIAVEQPVLIDVRSGLLHGSVKIVENRDGKARVSVRILQSSAKLADGEPVAASIQVEKLANVLMIERMGLLADNRTLELYRMNGEVADRVEVRTGKMTGNRVEILSGLKEGDRVIVTAMDIPKDAPRVRIQ
jgi:multidrug efflux pump subunit AcrA (membrane-fusion protein)